MTNYYCLVAGLPDLSLEDGKLNYTVANLKSEIYSEKDRKLIDLFYLKFDNANLLKLLKDKEAATDFEGNYSQNELLALISSVREGDAPDKRYPSYLYEFITAYLALSAEELYCAEDMYKPQNKMFHFCKTFCSKITLVNTIQNVILNPI